MSTSRFEVTSMKFKRQHVIRDSMFALMILWVALLPRAAVGNADSPPSDFAVNLRFGDSLRKCTQAHGVVIPDALIAFKLAVDDPAGVLQSWDPSLPNPCTWNHVLCNSENIIVRIELGGEQLSGPLVPEFGNLFALRSLELFNNNLTGEIPEELGKLSQLVSLDLFNNSLVGRLPASLGNLTNILYLSLQQNRLVGEVPATLGNLSSVHILQLQQNILTGRIPSELTKIQSLKTLDMSYNNLSGVIPKFASTVNASFVGNPGLHH